jgi:uncharacterized protein YjbJ (UPF0337 family)
MTDFYSMHNPYERKMEQEEPSQKKRRNTMNENILEGKWKQLRGAIREKWGELTDDELDQIAGKRDKLAGLLQEKYAERQINDFLERWEVPTH